MKRSILLLITTLVIFCVTLIVTDQYSRSQGLEEADIMNEFLVKDATLRMDNSLASRERSVHSFLSGLFDYRITRKGGRLDTLITVFYDDLRYMNRDVYDYLSDFVTINPSVTSAMFIVEPGIFPRFMDTYYAPIVERSDMKGKDIAFRLTPQQSKSYQYVKETGSSIWCLPSKNSPIRGKSIIYYVPIYLTGGRFMGVFTISVNMQVLRNEVYSDLPFKDVNYLLAMLDEKDDTIFTTYDRAKEHVFIAGTLEDMKEAINHAEPQENDSTGLVVTDKVGHRLLFHSETLKSAPWSVITIFNEDSVYKRVIRMQKVFVLISLVGLLLMLLCCYVVFRQIKENLQKRARVEEDLKIAAHVQMSLLRPTTQSDSSPVTAYIQPAKEVGGDLYDYAEVDGKTVFCIGDVSGKGMPAALFMTQVVSLFRSAVKRTQKPELIVADINNVLAANNPDMNFCTFFVGVLSDGLLTYCNAGHNKPVILSRSEPPRYLTVRPNLSLGLMPDYPYQAETTPLKAGTAMLLYTDGVTEAKNAKREEFGTDRLLTTLDGSDEVVADTRQAVKDFVAGYVQSDDITIMVVRG